CGQTDGNISDKAVDTSEFPSSESTGRTGTKGIGEASVDKILMGEFILRHFGNYVSPIEDTALEYEAEYILAGRDSDEENLKIAAKDMVFLRSGLNMISMMQDEGKQAQAEAIAEGILGFTGMPVLVESLKTIITGTWCMAEALCDVKTLMGGGKVAMVKAPSDWTVSSVGLKNFSKTVVPSANDDNGLGYEDYLRVMLLMQDREQQNMRTMDMIQADMCKNHNSEFRMKNCISSVKVTAVFEARQLFTAFGFVQDLVGSTPGRYGFMIDQGYSY
ncbi:MAG: hypothetical protein HUJ76_12215, partial [Parasporobacterium sp.]|nr:hypothetical protein [Parasporobacterium sp.]